MTRLSLLSAVAGIALLTACEKNAVQVITAPVDGGAFVRFHNMSVNSPVLNFYANTQKVTAASSTSCSPPPTTPNPLCATTGVEATSSTAGTVYGNVALGGNYAMLPPGTYALTGRIGTAADNGVTASTVNGTLEAGKFYSYFASGIYSTATKTTDAFMVEDKLPTSFDYSKAYVRVVNGSVNAPSISASTRLQGVTTDVTVATSVAYKGASDIITIAPGLTDVTVTLAGAPPVVLTGVNFIGGHVFTIVLRGDLNNSVAANRLGITIFANR